MRTVKKSIRMGILSIILAVLSCACSGNAKEGSEAQSTEADLPEQESAAQSLNRTPGGFPVEEEIGEDSLLYALSFQPWDNCQREDCYYDSYQSLGDRMYQMERGGDRLDALITVTDREGKPVHSFEVTVKSLGAREGSEIQSMDVLGEDRYAFLTAVPGEEYTVLSYELFLTDGEGQVKEHRDLTESYLEKGGLDYQGMSCLVDGAGYSYNYLLGRMIVADESGQTVLIQDLEGMESFGDPVRDGEGEFYFPIHEERLTTRIVYFDRQTLTFQTLTRLPEYVYQLYGILGSRLYYRTDEGIVCCDTAAGSQELLFSLKEIGFDLNSWSYLLLAQGEEPEVLIFDIYEGLRITLGREAPQPGPALQAISLLGAYDPGREGAAVASRRSALYDYTWESYQEESDRSRILAQLTAGEGPDILYLSPQDMELLGEKGALLDLRELISQETLDSLFPAAVGIGTREGKLWGIPDEFYVYSMVTTRSIWPEDTWTLSDFLDLAENTPDLVGLESSYAGAYYLFWRLICLDLMHSPFIDWEKGESLFEDEEFVRFLRIIKEKGETPDSDDPYQYGKWLREGKTLCYDEWIYALGEHSSLLKQFGSDAFMVGYPTETGNGSFGASYGVFAVSRNCSDREAATVYLETLLSESVQSKKGNNNHSVLAVRRQNWVIRDNQSPEEQARRENLMKDEAFLETCVPLQNPPQELDDIISQEVSEYLAGDTSAEEAARIIDNRVQLYLDENG